MLADHAAELTAELNHYTANDHLTETVRFSYELARKPIHPARPPGPGVSSNTKDRASSLGVLG